jgi:hypothetical protein
VTDTPALHKAPGSPVAMTAVGSRGLLGGAPFAGSITHSGGLAAPWLGVPARLGRHNG